MWIETLWQRSTSVWGLRRGSLYDPSCSSVAPAAAHLQVKVPAKKPALRSLSWSPTGVGGLFRRMEVLGGPVELVWGPSAESSSVCEQ